MKCKTLIDAGYLSTHSRIENLLAYALHLSNNNEDVTIDFSPSQGIWSQTILSKNPLNDYELPESIHVSPNSSDHMYDRSDVCCFGTPGVNKLKKLKLKKNPGYLIQFDEGSGSWQSKANLYKILLQEQTNLYSYTYAYKKIVKKILSDLYYLLIPTPTQNWSWFVSKSALIPNKRLIENLQYLYSRKVVKNSIHTDLVILTSPWVELGYCTKEKYLKKLSNIINNFPLNYVTIKPHPGENIMKYRDIKAQLYIENESIESALGSGKIKTKQILGEASTALVTTYLLFGIDTYCHSPIVPFPVSGTFKKALSTFVKDYSPTGQRL